MSRHPSPTTCPAFACQAPCRLPVSGGEGDIAGPSRPCLGPRRHHRGPRRDGERRSSGRAQHPGVVQGDGCGWDCPKGAGRPLDANLRPASPRAPAAHIPIRSRSILLKIEMPALRNLSFPDYGVRTFSYDPAARHAAVAMDGAWLFEGEGHDVGPGQRVIIGWTGLQVRTFEPREQRWSLATAGEQLKDICEAEFEFDRAILRGFSKATGLWTEYTFSAPVAYYETVV